MNSMQGKRVIITGPTSGVGQQVALQMASQGAELILACRDIEKGSQLAAEIEGYAWGPTPTVKYMDASSQASIRAFAQAILTKYSHLDVLINNAAGNRGSLPRIESEDGIELTFATNVLGYFLLTQELLDLLKQSAPARIVNVASTFASDLDLDDLQFERRPFDSSKAYAQSKACNRLFTWALARRLAGSGVTANAMTPGLITETGLYRHSPPAMVDRLTSFSGGRTSAMGADTVVWLASDPHLTATTDRFFENRIELPCAFRGEENEEKLWRICESLVNN